ncbi:hypothetical protein PHYPSEUDO_007754 [Phytophthora pseudosyringae]|uniref:Uncharacterized protein n=1 Tax=Phytophthora pseudosyringae TaxID=221518 RepID=A0A8T1VG31_9STRA|nr:hypothetical protein PHYPSEUDO_007754 [Phytophthora pseudosyringae]
MARARGSVTPAVDPLFEFDTPLSAPLSPLAPGAHDPWFDLVHPEHSKPSADLAREVADKLQGKEQQLKDAKPKSKSRPDWSVGKENQQPAADWREIVAARNKQLKKEKRSKHVSLREMRVTQEPFKVHKTSTEAKTVAAPASASHKKGRRPLMDVGNRLNSGRKRTLPGSETREMEGLQELLKKHNKKFKATHTYEPPQHSVREVKQWERETSKTYYALSTEERVLANQEIAVLKRRRQVERSHYSKKCN